MANLLGPDQVPNDRRGVREVVQTHRAARIRRQDAASVRTQHELRLSDRETLHSVPAADHLPTLRTGDPSALRRSQKRRTERASVERSRHDGDFAVQHPDQYGKYKKSVRHSGPQEDRHRPAAQPELHVRNLHRRGVQPPGPFGGYGRRGRSGPYAFQPAVYIRQLRTGQDPHRAVDRPRSAAAPSRTAGALHFDEQVPGAIPDRLQERRNSGFHPFLPDDRRIDYRRHPGAHGKNRHPERLLQHIQPLATGRQTVDPYLG